MYRRPDGNIGWVDPKKMKLIEFIKPDSIYVDVDVDSKKNLFKKFQVLLSVNDNEKSSIIIENLNERERLVLQALGMEWQFRIQKSIGFKKQKLFFLNLKSAINFSPLIN